MTLRITHLHPPAPGPLPLAQRLVRSRFLEACAHNQKAKLGSGLERELHYRRKVQLALEAWRRDPLGLVLRPTTVEPLGRSGAEVLVGLVLLHEPHIGLHLPIAGSQLPALFARTTTGGAA